MTLTSIGSYTVTRQLPGDGDTYLARSARGERCHMWLLDADVDETALEDTRAQMSACSQMDHSALVAASDLFTTDDGLAVAMAAADGADCSQLYMLIGRGNLTLAPEAVWYIGHQLAGALAVAHAGDDEDFLALCHGFISPRHVRIGWDGSVRLEGFGLAPLVTGGVLQGETGFVAPEQEGGKRVTPRGDIYALAAVLMALLTGRLPGPGATLDKRVPESLHEPLERALEEKLSQRRVTAMELEQWLAEAAAQKGRSALASAVATLRKSSAKLGGKKPSLRPKAMSPARGGSVPPKRSSRSAIPPVAKPGGLRATFGAKRKIPPLRSRQSTWMGGSNEEMPRRQATTPFNLDWDNVTVGRDSEPDEPVRAPIADELSWDGGASADDNPTTVMDREALLKLAAEKAAKQTAEGDSVPPLDTDDEDEATVMFSRDGLPADVLADLERGQNALGKSPDIGKTRPLFQNEIAALREPTPGTEAKTVPSTGAKTAPSTGAKSAPRAKAAPSARAKTAPSAGASKAGPADTAVKPGDGAPEDDAIESLVSTLDSETKLFKADLPAALEPVTLQRKAIKLDEPDPLEKTALLLDPPADEPTQDPADEPTQDIASAADAKAADAKEEPAADEQAPSEVPQPEPTESEASAVAGTSSDAAAEAAPQDAGESAQATPDEASDELPISISPPTPLDTPASDDAAGDASPWASADDEPEDKPLSLASMVLIVLVSAAAVFLAGMMWVRSNAEVGPPPVPTGAGSAATGKPSAAKPKPKARPAPTAKSSAAPTASASSATQSPQAQGPDGISDDPEAAAAPASVGLLRVRYTGPEKDPQVFVRGKPMGAVGSKIKLPCDRFAFITVGKPGPVFLSKGTTTKVTCQKLTQITVKPK